MSSSSVIAGQEMTMTLSLFDTLSHMAKKSYEYNFPAETEPPFLDRLTLLPPHSLHSRLVEASKTQEATFNVVKL